MGLEIKFQESIVLKDSGLWLDQETFGHLSLAELIEVFEEDPMMFLEDLGGLQGLIKEVVWIPGDGDQRSLFPALEGAAGRSTKAGGEKGGTGDGQEAHTKVSSGPQP